MNTKKIKYAKNFLPFIGLSLLIYIIYKVGINKIATSIACINPLYLLFSFLIFIPRIFMSTYKWQVISKKQGINVDLIPMIKINLIGLFYGTITPLWIGDAIRIFYLKEKSNESLGKCVSNYTIDQIITLLSLFILAMIGSIIVMNSFPYLILTIFLIFIALLSTIIILKNEKRGKKLFNIIYNFFLPDKFKDSIEKYSDEFYKSIPPIESLLMPLLIEILSYSLLFIQIYIIAIGMSIHIPFFEFIFIYPIASLIGQIPITISGFGTREGALIALFSIYGITAGETVALSLIGYVITFLIPSLIGLFFSFKLKL